jgi:hypothetical protein
MEMVKFKPLKMTDFYTLANNSEPKPNQPEI